MDLQASNRDPATSRKPVTRERVKSKYLSCGHTFEDNATRTSCCKLRICADCLKMCEDKYCPTCRGRNVMGPFNEYKGPWPTGAVTVLIGENRDRFDIHLDLLVDTSPLFAAIVKQQFPQFTRLGEDMPRERMAIHLPTPNAEIFAGFCQWLYTKENFIILPDCSFRAVAELWLMGETFLVPQLQNQIIHLGHKLASPKDKVMDLDTIAQIHMAAGSESPIARFFTAVYAQRLGERPELNRRDYEHLPIWSGAAKWSKVVDAWRYRQEAVGGPWPYKLVYNAAGEGGLDQFYVSEDMGGVADSLKSSTLMYTVRSLREMELV